MQKEQKPPFNIYCVCVCVYAHAHVCATFMEVTRKHWIPWSRNYGDCKPPIEGTEK